MPKPRSYDGTFEDMPEHVRLAAMVDRSWYVDARCSSPGGNVPSWAWTMDFKARRRVDGVVYKGETMNQLALTVCATCEVQWECASTAIEARERAGVWGARLDDLKMLREEFGDRAGDALMMAKSTGVSVQSLASQVRGGLS